MLPPLALELRYLLAFKIASPLGAVVHSWFATSLLIKTSRRDPYPSPNGKKRGTLTIYLMIPMQLATERYMLLPLIWPVGIIHAIAVTYLLFFSAMK